MGSGIDIKLIKANILEIASSVYDKKEDIADIILTERRRLSPINCRYTFALKVRHDDEKTQRLFEAFMKKSLSKEGLNVDRTSVIVENTVLKELFFLSCEVKDMGCKA